MMKYLNVMTRKPKSIQCHYKDSLIINSTNLESFLINHSISYAETENIVDLLFKYYDQKVGIILNACNDDNWTKLESFSSPLILFVRCIERVITDNEITLSKKSLFILKSFLLSLEPWMIW